MKNPIVNYHKDEEGHWVAQLFCGHSQHVRNNPPWDRSWVNGPWVECQEGRDSMLGYLLHCKKCDSGVAVDIQV
jgi:hypothetical protein